MKYYLVIGTSFECTAYGGKDIQLFGIFHTRKDAENYVKANQRKIRCKLTDEYNEWCNYILEVSKFVNGKPTYLYGDFGE